MSLYIFAGGGTGGHLYPGLAVAAELTQIEPGAQIIFACSNRQIDRKILQDLPYGMVPQPVRPIPHSPRDLWPFVRDYIASSRQAKEMIRDLKPAAVLGLGGFAAGPVMVRSARKGVRTAMINPDAVPGKANRLLARHAQAIFTQFEGTTDCFSASLRGRVRCVGCPIRGSFATATREAGVAMFDLVPGRKTLLVFGGSLGAESISLAIEALAQDLASAGQWQVLHVTGVASAAAIEKKLVAAGVPTRTLPYCNRMDLAYAVADLVLARGGAGTVAELAATGTPGVIMPYPYHKDQQQRLNAAALERAGAGMICDDAKTAQVNADNLRRIMLPLMKDASVLEKMRLAAANLGKPAAARDIARWLRGEE